MSMNKLGVGIIGVSPGASWAAVAHLPALRALPDFEVRAICNTSKASAEAAAREFGVPRAYGNVTEFLDNKHIDIVVVAVKVPHHHELTMAALAAGKHVFCEWPLGNGLREAVEMAESARAHGVHGVVGLQARCSPVINQVRKLVGEGYIGKLMSTTLIGSGMNWGSAVTGRDAYTMDGRNGATVLTIPFGHSVDALCYALGEFRQISANTGTGRDRYTELAPGVALPFGAAAQLGAYDPASSREFKVPDQVAVAGTLDNGAIASIHYKGGMSRGTNLLWEINGTEGDLQVTAIGGHMQIFDLVLSGGRGSDPALSPIPADPDCRWVGPDVPAGPALSIAQVYALMAQDIRNGTQTAPNFDDAVRRHRMIATVEMAAVQGGVKAG